MNHAFGLNSHELHNNPTCWDCKEETALLDCAYDRTGNSSAYAQYGSYQGTRLLQRNRSNSKFDATPEPKLHWKS